MRKKARPVAIGRAVSIGTDKGTSAPAGLGITERWNRGHPVPCPHGGPAFFIDTRTEQMPRKQGCWTELALGLQEPCQLRQCQRRPDKLGLADNLRASLSFSMPNSGLRPAVDDRNPSGRLWFAIRSVSSDTTVNANEDVLSNVFGVTSAVGQIPAASAPFVLPHKARKTSGR